MGRLRNISGQEAVKAFRKAGWRTLRALIRNADLSVEAFLELL